MKQAEFHKILDRLEHHMPADLVLNVNGTPVTRRFTPPQRLVLLGGGHISQALCRFAAEVDFSVTVVDDRPAFANSELFPGADRIICDSFAAAIAQLELTAYDYVCVLTRGHRWDGECLRQIFQGTMPAYLGLVGSKRRVSGLFDLLAADGYDRALMQQVSTPIGLSIGAVTPQEIGISILAELIQQRHKAAPDASVLALENADFGLLHDLAEEPGRAVAVVVFSKGSVPVEPGAIMGVNLLGRTSGTVGGGCGEYEVISAARAALRDGHPKLLEVDMTNEVAEREGMVCGGRMQVWLEPIEA